MAVDFGDRVPDVLGDPGHGGDPHSVHVLDAADQLFQGHGFRGPAGDERVVGQYEATPGRMVCLRFQRPHFQDLGGAFDDAAAGDPGIERVLLPVVERPIHRDFHQVPGIALADAEAVRCIAVEQA
ncbi:hypothetical protein D9M72_518640 [compost metagenome]